MLDKQGDHAMSSKRYSLAAKKFEEMAEGAENQADRRELRTTIYLCQAWQRMTLAEAEVSPDLYMEAAGLFMKAKECSLDEKVRVAALGNSCFCKALEAGAKFEVARDRTQYLTATQHLESAASYYAKAGLESATEYAKATQRLFDAYLYVDDAKKERDAEKKAKYYIMAEKVLEMSVVSYLNAKYHEKSNAVERLLEDVREERQLAVSLSEMLRAPPIAAATATLSPLPTREEAAGLMRFQHADIQATLVITSEEAFVGEDLEIEIELVNTGKSPAFLIKVAEIIPQGFELKKKPERYRMEERHLNMKGKRLGPLGTEELKLVLKPMSTGSFIFKPRIIYLDETGKRMSHEPKSAGITVKELGIRGWIKGKR